MHTQYIMLLKSHEGYGVADIVYAWYRSFAQISPTLQPRFKSNKGKLPPGERIHTRK